MRIARWLIFVFDQAITNGLRFIPLFRTEFLTKEYDCSVVPFLVIVSRSVSRPSSQIVTAYFNSNLTDKNLRKWVRIACLNSVRALALCLVNYWAMEAMRK